MLKATVKLSRGRTVTIEGPPEEVKGILEHLQDRQGARSSTAKPRGAPPTKAATPSALRKELTPEQMLEIVNKIRNCEEAERIDKHVLDKSSEQDRVLLPLYVIHQYLHDKYSLTTTEISRITAELRTRISRQNVLRGIDKAARYVQPDRTRRPGTPTRYRINRRGIQYMKDVIAGKDLGED